MNRAISLYLEIKRLKKTEERRSPLFQMNKFALFMILLVLLVYVVEIFVIGLFLPDILSSFFPAMEPYHMFNRGMVILLILDFYIRYLFQQTPTQEIKPFALLPISKKFIIKCFLVSDLLRFYNIFWFVLLVPFACMSIFKFYFFSGIIGFLLGWWMLFLLNSMLYLMFRTLTKHNIFWCFAPIVLFGMICAAAFLIPQAGMVFINFGEGFILWNPISFIIVLLLIAGLFKLNIFVQYKYMNEELTGGIEKEEKTKINNFTYLERWGEIGEYLKLEIKSVLRNKMIRKQYIAGICLISVFSALLAFSDIYADSLFMNDFIGLYGCAALGSMTLPNIMAVEGNYIDGLMVRKESIYNLLRAKYYFHCTVALLPFCIMLVPVCAGSSSVFALISYLFATTGISFFAFFILAIYNKEKIELNQTLTNKVRTNNYLQIIASLGALFIPMLISRVLNAAVPNLGYVFLLVAGLIMMAFHKYWLKLIYHQFMKHRYENLEGFRN